MNTLEMAKKKKEEELKIKKEAEDIKNKKAEALRKQKEDLVSYIEKALSPFKAAGFDYTYENDKWRLISKDGYLILACSINFSPGYSKPVCNDDYFKYDGDSYYIILTNKKGYSWSIQRNDELDERISNIMKDYI